MSDVSDKAPELPTKRRWFQYSLRSLMIVMTVLCVWLAYISNEAREQKDAVAWVEEMGGKAVYDYEYDERDIWIKDAQPPGPVWLREWIGVDYFSEVTVVKLSGTQIHDLSPLAVFKNLEWLDLYNTQVEDLSPLVGLTSLQWLSLELTEVSNISPLLGLTNLEELDLTVTQVTKEEVQKLQLALPNCKIGWDGK